MDPHRLIQWFSRHRRDLPWRRNRSAYKTWISEMMLQQTQVKTVIPYFKRWMKVLPNLKALDQCPEEKVLTLWQGLGYYNRARQIKKTASFLMKRHNGRFPKEVTELLKLPGIGPYSAGAIASLGFNQKATCIDGNVLRVAARFYGIRSSIGDAKTKAGIQEILLKVLPENKPGLFNEALMELGATLCMPKNPECFRCPLRKNCTAFQTGWQNNIPVLKKRKPIQNVRAVAVILSRKNRFLLLRRPVGELMGGLWEFPEWKMPPEGQDSKGSVLKFASKKLSIDKRGLYFVSRIRRHYTRFRESLEVFRMKEPFQFSIKNPWPRRWVRARDLPRYPLTSAHSKIRDLVLAQPALR